MKILKLICGYQALSWGFAIAQYFYLMYVTIRDNPNLLFTIFLLVMISLFSFLFYINICIVFGFKKDHVVKFLTINIYANILQSFYVVFAGVTFYLEFGLYLLLFLKIDDTTTIISPTYSLFESGLGLKFNSENHIFFLGINIVAVGLAIWLNNIKKKIVRTNLLMRKL